MSLPDTMTPTTPSQLFAMSYLAHHKRGLPKLGTVLTDTPPPACHLCAHTAPAHIPRIAATKKWYPQTFSDWNRILDLESGALCGACAYTLKNGLKGFVLTATEARRLKPSSPEWAHLLANPPAPPFALILNCTHLKKGRLTADGAKPRHLMLSGRVAYNRDQFPVSYGVHEVTDIRAADAHALLHGWRTLIQEGLASGLWNTTHIPKFLTIIASRWLTQQNVPSTWSESMKSIYSTLPVPLLSSRLVLEFTIRRALIAEFAATPSPTPSRRRTTKGVSR